MDKSEFLSVEESTIRFEETNVKAQYSWFSFGNDMVIEKSDLSSVKEFLKPLYKWLSYAYKAFDSEVTDSPDEEIQLIENEFFQSRFKLRTRKQELIDSYPAILDIIPDIAFDYNPNDFFCEEVSKALLQIDSGTELTQSFWGYYNVIMNPPQKNKVVHCRPLAPNGYTNKVYRLDLITYAVLKSDFPDLNRYEFSKSKIKNIDSGTLIRKIREHLGLLNNSFVNIEATLNGSRKNITVKIEENCVNDFKKINLDLIKDFDISKILSVDKDMKYVVNREAINRMNHLIDRNLGIDSKF